MENKKELRTWLDNFGLDHPLVIAGPCSAETEEQVLTIAHQLKDSDATVLRAGIWKPRTRQGSRAAKTLKTMVCLRSLWERVRDQVHMQSAHACAVQTPLITIYSSRIFELLLKQIPISHIT